jgi:hypothetical protein
VHSPRDKTVPFADSEALVAALNGAGREGPAGAGAVGRWELVPFDDDHALNGVLRGSPALLLRLCHRVVSSQPEGVALLGVFGPADAGAPATASGSGDSEAPGPR